MKTIIVPALALRLSAVAFDQTVSPSASLADPELPVFAGDILVGIDERSLRAVSSRGGGDSR
jgi:hypothetical protein